MRLTHSNCKTNTARFLGEISVFLKKSWSCYFKSCNGLNLAVGSCFHTTFFFFFKVVFTALEL